MKRLSLGAEALFDALLRLYPAPFRRRYARDMREHFRDAWAATPARRRMRLLTIVVADAARVGARQRLVRPPTRVPRFESPRAHLMSDLATDLRFALRGLRRNPLFTAVAVITIALGIGANTAIFSLVSAVLLRPMPYGDSDRLVALSMANPAEGIAHEDASVGDTLDWQEHATSLEAVGAYGPMGYTLVGDNGAENIHALWVTAGLFGALGVEPVLGRALQPEDSEPGNHQSVILSHRLWRQRFGADPAIIDSMLTLDSADYRVIGVMPPGFRIPQDEVGEVGIYAPFPFDRTRIVRQARWLHPIARLRDGVTLEQAQADLDRTAVYLGETYPDSNAGWMIRATPLRRHIAGDSYGPLLILQFAAGFVVLISCVNVAGLLLGRVEARRGEIAVRTALGAQRGRLLRLLVTESLLLAVIGGSLGLLLAYQGLGAMASVLPAGLIAFGSLTIDTPVLLFALLLSALTGLFFGMAPAWQASRVGVRQLLQAAGTASTGRLRLRSSLVVAEVALALVLLVGAGLLLRSFAHLLAVDLGIRTENVLTFQIAPERDAEGRARFYDDAAARIQRLPGVVATSANTMLPLTGSDWLTEFDRPGRPFVDLETQPRALYYSIMPGYFDTVGGRIVAGRDFNQLDIRSEIGSAIISQSMAERFWPDEDPLDDVISVGMRFGRDDPATYRIVGVVGDITHGRPQDQVGPSLYVPHTQQTSHHMNFVVRTTDDPVGLVDSIRAEITAIDSGTAIDGIATLDELFASSVSDRRFNMLLLGFFAALALLLAAIGLYGVMASLVIERTREIGIQMALGAPRASVMRAILRRSIALVGIGVLIGATVSAATARVISSLLFGVSPTDPTVVVAVLLLLTLVAMLAAYMPARKATRIDPATALRSD